jgi:transcriptional regulator of nitric oxide reductase
MRRWLAWVLLAALGSASAGTLSKADVEALFPPPMIVGEKLAHLPAWPVFVRTGQGPVLMNHVFETADLEPVAGYGGKPINLLVVMDRDGAFVQARLLSHMEPIFRSPEGTATLTRFGQQYQGLTVHHQIQVLGAKAKRVVTPTQATLHGIVAGTVTALAIDRSIMEAAAQVAQAGADPQAAARSGAAATGPDDRYQRTGFNGLVAARLIQPLVIENRALEARFAGTAGAGRDAEGSIRPGNAAVDLWLAFAGVPQAGRNLLDPVRWREVRELRERGAPVLLMLEGSRYALEEPSTGRLRGARLGIRQGAREFAVQPLPWTKGLRMSGQHSGVASGAAVRYYRVLPARDGAAFDPLAPATLVLSAWRRTGEAAGDVAWATFEQQFEVPQAAAYRPQREAPRWLEPWAQRAPDLAVLGAGLMLLTLGLVSQRWMARSRQRLERLRTAMLAFTLLFIGWWAQGQLTVVSLTALVEALVAGRSAEFLLMDPMAVVLWAFTLVTLLVWGRGTFCGWLCPFGALQELLASGARRLGLMQRRLRATLDARLKLMKYAVLAVLLGAAVVSPAWTEVLLEVEPFKTSISLYFVRSWPYVAWAGACLALGVFFFRGYCRYLCPLGAALALGGVLRRWAWIPRRPECGTPCQTCRHRCEYQAIAPSGRVSYAECFQCLDCVQVHDDAKACLPLVSRARGKVVSVPVVAAATGLQVARAP